MSCGVNQSSLFKWLLLQNFVKINETTFFSLKLFPVIAAGPQKPQKLTSSKIKYEKFRSKILIFKKYFTVKITLISMIKKMPLTFLDVKK